MLSRYKEITPQTKILEIGTGAGWFPIFCALRGLSCKGLEISPQLIDLARENGRNGAVKPDIELGNLGRLSVAARFLESSWRLRFSSMSRTGEPALAKVYETLNQAEFSISNRQTSSAFVSGEYTGIPLYGWLPNSWRYALRKQVEGEDIMKLGIDFHQFTHSCCGKNLGGWGFREFWTSGSGGRRACQHGLRRNVVRVAKRIGLARSHGPYVHRSDALHLH